MVLRESGILTAVRSLLGTNMWRETDLAWAAGIIDGEGCILLNIAHTNTGTAYVLRVIVSNTSILMLNRLKEIFGVGNVIPRWKDQSKRPKNARMAWYYEASTKKAEYVLNLVLPYLVNKKPEAEIGLLSRKYIGVHGRNTENPNTEQLLWLRGRLSELKVAP